MCKISFIIMIDDSNVDSLKECIYSIKNMPKENYRIFICDNRKVKGENKLFDEYKKYVVGSGVVDCLKKICSQANSEYVQILTAGDRVSIDWGYEIEKNDKFDVIISSQIYRGTNGEFIYNLSSDGVFENENAIDDILKFYFLSGGEDRYVREIDNKAFSREIILKALDNIQNTTNIFVNWEIVLNALLLSRKIIFAKNSYVSYDLTNDRKIFAQDSKRTLLDASEFLDAIKNKAPIELRQKADIWIDDWLRNLIRCLEAYHTDHNVIKENVKEIFERDIKEKNGNGYFESLITPIGYSYKYLDEIKQKIASEGVQYVGFDIFDTLIERPFWEPVDLFKFLNKKFNELIGKKTVIDFSLIRKEGEQNCRRYYHEIRPSNEDVTISEIYDFISEQYGFDKKITDEICKYEIQLEKKFCSARKIGTILYDWALYCEKKIVIISDMYLDKKIIEDILQNAGYKNYEKLYLSNDIGVSKYSGNLYRYVLDDMQISSEDICFMGDNYGVDFLNPQKLGIKAFHIPKATELFQGLNGAIYTGDFYKNIYDQKGIIIDSGTVLKFIGIRCMMAVVANKIFGNPFVTINRDSDFNADGKFIGYYCAGMFLFSEAMWLIGEGRKNGLDTIHFVARDGYYVKRAYDLISSKIENTAKSNYLYFSRKAVVPLYLSEPEGIYEIFLPPHILSNTPLSVIKSLKSVTKQNIDVEEVLRKNNIVPFKKFASLNEYYRFAHIYTRELYDVVAAKKYKELLRNYFGNLVGNNDAIYDVGYSGRMETALTKLLGYPVNSYYFHEHEPWALQRKEEIGFNIDTFYGFKPCSAFVLREQIFTPAQPSCVGFTEEEGNIKPEFGTYKASYKEEFILGNIQRNAIRFVDDMVSIFDDDILQIQFNRFDACIPFEYYMHFAKDFDRKVMLAVDFEDEFGTNEILSICDYWDKEQKAFGLYLNQPQKINEQDVLALKEQLRLEIYAEEGVFKDGTFMKMYKKINRVFPIGSRRRELIKKIVGK